MSPRTGAVRQGIEVYMRVTNKHIHTGSIETKSSKCFARNATASPRKKTYIFFSDKSLCYKSSNHSPNNV